MNATIRYHHLGLTVPTETARQFSIKLTISFTIITLATLCLLWQEVGIFTSKGKTPLTSLKNKVGKARRKIENLY
ncbi:hypothetical protein [Belliella pelovolcani]|uniref:hypothetical protein n=1 Tax=Belliella pelovolcani TaxID=529505 RepID=UPI0039188C26